jgi:hypothetical protein
MGRRKTVKTSEESTIKEQSKEYVSGTKKYRCDFKSYEEYYKYKGEKG